MRFGELLAQLPGTKKGMNRHYVPEPRQLGAYHLDETVSEDGAGSYSEASFSSISSEGKSVAYWLTQSNSPTTKRGGYADVEGKPVTGVSV